MRVKDPPHSLDLAAVALHIAILALLGWLFSGFGPPDTPLLIFLVLCALAVFPLLLYRRLHQNRRRLDDIRRLLRSVRNVNQLLISEDDPLRLIERACAELTETLGYRGAWIALLDKGPGDPVVTASSGTARRLAELSARLEAGDPPPCVASALESAEVVVMHDPRDACAACPLGADTPDCARLSRRLHHGGKLFGILAVSMPGASGFDPEGIGLFSEMADDLGFALHKIDAAKRLRESEKEYRTLFNQSVAGIYLHDLEGNIHDVNQMACVQSGYSRDELLRMTIFDLHPDAAESSNISRDEIMRLWQQWQPDQSYMLEAEHRHKDGTIFPIELSSGIIRYDHGDRIQAIVQDITQRKQAERDLVHSRDLMRYIIEHNRSAIAVHDRDLNYIYVSQRYLDDYGIQDRDVIGKHHYAVLPDLPQKWRDVHQRSLKGEIISAEDDVFERADGTVDWTRWESRPWYEADGTVGGIIVYTELITERKEMERYLRRQERLAAVGQLAAGISHDFRNLITTIIAYGQLGKRVPDLPAKSSQCLDIIVGEAHKATHLIGQILDFSRSTELDLQLLDLPALVGTVVDILQRTLPSTIRITFDAGEDPCLIEGDAGRLQQVLTNLALNARDAMPGGGALHIGVTRAVITPGTVPGLSEAEAASTWICLSVADTGHGMSEAALAHLFEPFYTTKGNGQGTGLGLAQVYGIVKLHAGHIDLSTVTGQGVTFRIYLPPASPERIDDPVSSGAVTTFVHDA